jgi:hypothetical protein
MTKNFSNETVPEQKLELRDVLRVPIRPKPAPRVPIDYAWGSYYETQILLEANAQTQERAARSVAGCKQVKRWSSRFSAQPSLAHAVVQAAAHPPGNSPTAGRQISFPIEILLGHPRREFVNQYRTKIFTVEHMAGEYPMALHVLVEPDSPESDPDLYISNTCETPSHDTAQWVSQSVGQDLGNRPGPACLHLKRQKRKSWRRSQRGPREGGGALRQNQTCAGTRKSIYVYRVRE